MPNFYIAPLHIIDNTGRGGSLYRTAPLFQSARFNPAGLLTGAWSLKDFDNSKTHALLITADPIPTPLLTPDFFAFPNDLFKAPETKDRDDIHGFLADAGIEGAWVKEGESLREILHRLMGMTQAMQAGRDTPEEWLIKPVYCGHATLVPYDAKGFEFAEFQRQSLLMEQIQQLYPYPARIEGGNLYFDLPKGHRLNPEGGWTWIGGGGALPYTDTFTVGSDTSIASHPNWSVNAGAMTVLAATDDVRGNSAGAESAARDNSNTYANNQYAQVLINALTGSGYIGAATRCSTSGANTYYGWYPGVPDEYLFKVVTGTFTQLGSTGGAGASGVTYRLESNGTTHTPIQAGSTSSPPGAQTDSAIASGSAGISGYSNEASRGDNFEGGDLGGGAAGQPTMRRWQNIPHMRVRGV